jgi:hypothetical protein
MSFDRAKFKSLVLHMIWRTNHVAGFGLTKLNKALWFSEARSYEAYGALITGEEFVRDKYGPRSKHLREICAELEADGLVEPFVENVGEYNATRYRALSPADTSMFSQHQMTLIDWWIATIADKHTAKSISELSHDYGWEVARMGEPLPAHAFLARRIREPQTDDELEWAKREVARLGLK